MINRLLGQYNSKSTLFHNLDPRIKILLVIAFSSILISIDRIGNFIVATLLMVLSLLMAKVKIAVLARSIGAFTLFYVLILFMYLVFAKEKIILGLFSFWKFLLLMCLTIILTSTTTHSSLVKGIEKILYPLKYLKINTRNIAIMISITIKFIPAFFLYGQGVRDAHTSRLADFRKIRSIRLFISKLFTRLIGSASTLADAIEARGYNIKNCDYTSFKELKLRFNDYIALFAGLLLVAGILLSK